ncbi:hypothetical protein, partial [Nocardioides guangzhouensis]|uniref:hypothetical protein n=1 Tax=Nocardioides guangzhouensis TaxID=2497878 RepID=UPI001C37B42E
MTATISAPTGADSCRAAARLPTAAALTAVIARSRDQCAHGEHDDHQPAEHHQQWPHPSQVG